MGTLVQGAPTSALAEGSERARYVQRMFARITPCYDMLNRVISVGLDQRWRRRTLALLEVPTGARLLDLCCGTGDLALAAQDLDGAPRVVAADFCAPMVLEADRKARVRGRPLPLSVADALRLPFADGSFDRLTVGFGVRNLGDLDAGLAELYRVLAPGGRLGILEASTPTNPVLRAGSNFYLRHVLPRIGRLLATDSEAYAYLPETILRFPDQPALAAKLEAVGFQDVHYENQLFGAVCIHVGTRPAG